MNPEESFGIIEADEEEKPEEIEKTVSATLVLTKEQVRTNLYRSMNFVRVMILSNKKVK